MNFGALLKTTKGKILAGAGGTVVAVGIGVAVLLQGGGYRSIAVEQVAGTVNVVGEMNNGQAYKGEHLYSGDDVTVMDASELVMCMDNDKYVYADANTHFKLEASDKSEDSRIKIYLDAGSELNELQSKLEAGETYEVDTPNSTMSVRGTSFRVTVYKASDGLIYTLTEITTGEVLVRLKTTDGSYNGVEKLFTPGQSALIRGNSEFSEFVSSGLLDANDIENTDDDDALELAYGSLPQDGMERLIALLEGGNLIASDEEPETIEEVKDIKKEEVKKEEPEKKEEVEEDTTEEETDEDDTEEEEDNRTFLQKLAEAAIASRNDDGTINLKDGTLFDPDYYASLLEDNTDPLYNRATMMRTAPGSTFKPISAVTGVSEGVLGIDEYITDLGVFEEVYTKPKCWIYRDFRLTHGSINIPTAIDISCNYFFFTVGYRLATRSHKYVDDEGLASLKKYAIFKC